MARGDQLVRQWSILDLLKRGRCSRRDLALELGVSLKTIARDIDALTLFPITEEREGIDVFYELMRDGHLPGISFEPQEVIALVFAKDVVLPSLERTPFRSAFASALEKVEKNQRTRAHRNLKRFPEVYQVYPTSQRTIRRFDESLFKSLIDAALEQRLVCIDYFTVHRQALTQRNVEPFVVYQSPHGLRLIAYCHFRQEVRIFSLNQIRGLKVLDQNFDLEARRFDLESFLLDSFDDMRSPPVVDVRLHVSYPTAHWARDRNYHPTQKITEVEDGIEITFTAPGLPAIAARVMGLGTDCRVLAPKALKDLVLERAKKIVAHYE